MRVWLWTAIYDAENNNSVPPKSQEIPLQSDLSTEEMRNTPGTTHECPSEFFPQTDEVSDVTDTYPHMEPDVESISEQPDKSPTNPPVPNTTWVITRNLTAMVTTDISLSAELVCSTERARKCSKNSRNALRGTYVAIKICGLFYSGYSLVTNSLATQSWLLQNPATNTKFINIFSIFWPFLIHYSIIFSVSTIWVEYYT